MAVLTGGRNRERPLELQFRRFSGYPQGGWLYSQAIFADNKGMLVILYRRNESGRAYYYTLDDRQQSLFNPHTLTVSWGLHPEGGRRKTYVFETAEEKNRMIRQLIRRKMRSSYQVLYSYFKEMQERLRTESLLNQSRAIAAGGDVPRREGPQPNRDWARRGG